MCDGEYMKNKRIWELDFLRGFAIIMMVFDHMMYDLAHLDNYFNNFYIIDLDFFNSLNHLAEMYWSSGLRFWGHHFFVGVFLLVSGISFTFSKNNLTRSLKMLAVALGITLVTWVIELTTNMRVLIILGVIHMYAISTFVTYLVKRFIKNDIVILLIGLGIIILGFELEFWNLHYIGSVSLADVPGLLIGTKAFGADYFSIVPYLGVIMIGTVIGNRFYTNKTTIFPQVKVTDKNIVVLSGRYSIYIFLLHQIVLFILIFGIGMLFGYRL